MRILALDGALARCSVALWEQRWEGDYAMGGRVLAGGAADGARGHASVLPALVRNALMATPGAPDAVAVTVGPGGFTGLRAALALARGLALGWDVPCVGVSVGEALAAALSPEHYAGRAIWSAVDTKRGRIALERPDEAPAVFDADALPFPPGPVVLVGDAAAGAAVLLLARGADALLASPRLPEAVHVARVAAGRLRGDLPPRAAEPMYLEAPATRGPAGSAAA